MEGAGGISQLSTGKSSLDHLIVQNPNTRSISSSNNAYSNRPESINQIGVRHSNYFSVVETEEDDESPLLGLSPLIKPVMH